MKKIFIGLICVFMLMGCSNVETVRSEDVPESPIVVKTAKQECRVVGENTVFEYVEIDDHIYLMFWSGHRGGITHSGTCPCNPNHNYRGQ